jgi:Holliday junction DNA helicase RuvA
MIGQLRGVLAAKRPNQVLVDVDGVGYEVEIPLSTFYGLPALHGDVSLLIYTHVREDQITLFGFLSTREKHFFELLLSVSGVGPSVALKVLSGLSIDELIPAVQKGDLGQLTRIPGVGKKTAERIVLELRDKMAALTAAEMREGRHEPAGQGALEGDVISALVNLGYQRRNVEKAVEEARRGAGAGFEALLKASLQRLSKV